MIGKLYLSAGNVFMPTAMNQLQLSARGYHRVLKLAYLIVILAGEESGFIPQGVEALLMDLSMLVAKY